MKRVICLLLTMIMTLTLCACSPFDLAKAIMERIEQNIIEEQQLTPRIGFARSPSEKDSIDIRNMELYMTKDELYAYENEYAAYRSNMIFNTLSEEEQTTFLAAEYALVNCYDYIFIDTRLMDDAQAAERVVEYLSFESPFLAQNVICGAHITTITYEYKYAKKDSVQVPQLSLSLRVQSFSEKIWRQNEQAFERAKEIFAQLNTGGSKSELIERLYTYVATNIEYDSGAGETRLRSYLHDAFISKKTNCDGFSNALALLLSMADVPNLEKCDTLDVEEGHTWNCFELEGKWYNCDATGGDWIPVKETSMGPGLLFGFADYLQESEHDHFIRFPECKEPLYMKPTAELAESRGAEFFNAINEGFIANDKTWVLVIVETLNEDGLNPQVQKLANRYQLDLYGHFLDLADGRTAILIYKEGIY